MESEETIAVKCKSCHETLTVPKRLKEFSCMFCGARMKLSELSAGEHEIAQAEELYEYALQNIIRCVSDHRDIHRDFNKFAYPVKMDAYKASCREIIEKLDSAILTSPERSPEMLSGVASRFLDDMEKLWESDPRSRSLTKRAAMLEEDRIMIALYMIPMIRDTELQSAEDIAAAIHDEWLRRYPKTPFSLAKKADIQEGFQHKWRFRTQRR